MPVSVLVADHDAVFRRLIRRTIEGVVELVGEATSEVEARRMVQELRPDVILMDIDLPVPGGVETTRRIKAEQPEIKVILMTAHEEEAYLLNTGKSGADALLPKKNLKTDVFPVIRTLLWDVSRLWDRRISGGRRTPGRPSSWDGGERRKNPVSVNEPRVDSHSGKHKGKRKKDEDVA